MKQLIVLLLWPLLASAEPASPSKFLMNEPATLFDVGMVRLGILTTDFERRVGLLWTTASGTSEFFRAGVNSSYDAKDDKISVHFLIMNSVATDAQMKEGCEMAMGQMSIWLMKSLPHLFLHEGIDNSPATFKRYDNFTDMFELSCYVSSANDTSVGRFWARRTLRDPVLKIGPWE
jgi:hypothetical protein